MGQVESADPTGILECTGIQQQASRLIHVSNIFQIPQQAELGRDLVEVTGTGNVVAAVTSVLARNQIVAEQLRVDQASLEDAFVALTGHDTRRDVK